MECNGPVGSVPGSKVLWLSGECLVPADNGLYRYSQDIMSALGEMGHQICAIGRRRSGPPVAQPTGWTLLAHRAPPMWKKMAGRYPAKVTEIWADDYAGAVLTALEEFTPDVVLLDHLRTGAALDAISSRVPSIYVSHNDETRVRAKMIHAAGGIRQAALRVDLKKIRWFEDRLLCECAAVSAITSVDANSFAARNPTGPIVLTPPTYRGTRLEQRTITAHTPRRIAMISTLHWGAKIDNMIMALEGLQPLLDQGIEIVVFTGGYPPPTDIRNRYPKVRFEGFVDDFEAALADCRIGVIYEPVGGGFKMKTLDFIFHRVPLVTGHDSAADLPLTPDHSVVEVQSETELAGSITELIDDLERLNALHEAAYEQCRGLFTTESVRPLSDLIHGITSSRRSSHPFSRDASIPSKPGHTSGAASVGRSSAP
ncbi:MAG: glycosyltransferase [Acidimicrobiia bacterium]|nr:glycosyltransferase [Acidimicrobiia bacterium]